MLLKTRWYFGLWFQRLAQSLAYLSSDGPAVFVVNVNALTHREALVTIKTNARPQTNARPFRILNRSTDGTGDRRFWLSARALFCDSGSW